MPTAKTQTIRDRTQEFQNIAERAKKVQEGGNASGSLPSTRAVIQQKSEFANKASEIGMGIHKTSMKLQKLAQLAKRTSMFDDPAQEIAEISGIVKQDIQQLHASIADLQKVSMKSGGVMSSQEENHSKTVVDNLRNRLKDTTKNFKDVLTVRSENLKDQNERRQLFSTVPENGVNENEPLLASKNAHDMFGGQDKRVEGTSTSMSESHLTHSTSYDPYPNSSMAIRARPSINQQQMQMMQPQDTYLANRAEAMQQVESTIVELGGIFQQLAHMVKEQGEMAVRIDENIGETFSNVESAQGQLLKYLNNISSNRWLVMKIFLVLMIFLVVFVIFLA